MLFEELKDLIDSLHYTRIPDDRKGVLEPLVGAINKKKEKGETIKLLFICTHNSRRSHLAQIWSLVVAKYFSVPIESYSGGVEVTAMNERIVRELERTGFAVEKGSGRNPHYQVSYSRPEERVSCYSKRYDDEANPDHGFIAVMTCSDADENCPFIAGAETRIAITYEDPKEFDDTPLEADKYHDRSMQIANEMAYVFSKIS